jgi:hypothetical protein
LISEDDIITSFEFSPLRRKEAKRMGILRHFAWRFH